MKLMRSTRLIAAAFTLVVLSAATAAAQAPVLSVSANGATVTINWTDLSAQGALGYNLVVGTTSGGSQVASVNLPSTITNIVVAAPSGSYFLRVRGLAASGFGPFSNEASVTVGASGPGPGPCAAPSAPTVSATTAGLSVTVDWGAAAGAAGYRVEFSMTPTGTNLVQTVGAGTQSYSQYVGMAGTFYVRVVAVNGCGSTASSTVAFTTGAGAPPTGSGPRTPDPAPGQLLPPPAYVGDVVQAMARAYPGDLFNSCREHGGNNVFMFRVLQALRQRDSRFGLNYKRGQYGDLSQDIVTYNPTDRPDDRESRVYLWDIIGGHCGDSPGPNWADVTSATWTQRGNPACGTEWCAMWTIEPYLRAGFPADPRQ
jgi:hypothetical protein